MFCFRGMDQFHVCLPVGPNELALVTVEYQQMLIMRLGIVRYSVNIQPTQHVNRIYGRVSNMAVGSGRVGKVVALPITLLSQ